MAFEEVQSLDADVTVSLGGFNRKTKMDNPTQAQGYYLGSKQVQSTKSPSGFTNLHILQTEEGSTLGVWGKTDLDKKLINVKPGYLVRITCTGTRPTNGNEMYLFRVEVDKSTSIEVNAATPSTLNNTNYSDNEDGETESFDEQVPTRATKPTVPTAAPSAARQAQARELLNKAKARTNA